MNLGSTMNFEEVKVRNPGILSYTIPEPIFNSFSKEVINIPNNKTNLINWNKNLIGQIEEEYKLNCPGNLKIYLLEAAKNYCSYFKYGFSDRFSLTNFWINFQKKYEYNPLHDHSGFLSFIIFVKVPFLLENEDKLSNTINSNSHLNGRLSFVYESMFNGTRYQEIDCDQSFAGKLFMFPSSALHTVYPFYTSDDYRITVSGNIDILRD